MDEYITEILNNLKLLKIKDYHDHEVTIDTIFGRLMPKKSKILSRNIKKRVFESKDSMNIVIVIHLYFERMLNEILDKELKDYSNLQKEGLFNSFYKKIIFLKTQCLINNDIANDLIVFNKLRNKFAHKLNYELCEFDFFEFTCFKSNKNQLIVKRKADRNIFNRILIKHFFIWIEYQMLQQHSILFLINE